MADKRKEDFQTIAWLRFSLLVLLVLVGCLVAYIITQPIQGYTHVQNTRPEPIQGHAHVQDATPNPVRGSEVRDSRGGRIQERQRSFGRSQGGVTVNLSRAGWPEAAVELGVAWPRIAESWDPGVVYSGSPAHPLGKYRNPCWEEVVTRQQAIRAYKHNGFLKVVAGDIRTKQRLYRHQIEHGLRKAQIILRNQFKRSQGTPVVKLRCLPAIYVIGMYKAGSTDLYDKISTHPQVTPSLTKASQFPKSYISFKDFLEYNDVPANKIRKRPSLVTLDAFASLFYLRKDSKDGSSHLYVAEIIKYNPRAIFLLALRDPVSWIYSAYNYWGRRTNPEDFHRRIQKGINDFNQCKNKFENISYCVISHKQKRRDIAGRVFQLPYFVFVDELLKVLPPEQLMVVRAEEYYQNRTPTMKKIFGKLKLKSMDANWYRKKIKSTSVKNKRRYKDMLAKTEKTLKDFVRPFNHKLAHLMNDEGFKWGL